MSSRKTDSQDPAKPLQSEPVSIYVHIPFCEKRCLYCDFVTEAGINHLIPDYLAALSRELEEVAEGFPATAHIHTIYLGGGTPSILPTEGVKALLDRISQGFPSASER